MLVGCNVNIPNKQGDTVLYVACKKMDELLISKLLTRPDIALDCGIDRLPLHEACIQGNLDVVRQLIEAGANVNAVSFIKTIVVFVFLQTQSKAITLKFLMLVYFYTN